MRSTELAARSKSIAELAEMNTFVRFGSFSVVSPERVARPLTSLAEALMEALGEDSRVVSVFDSTVLNEEWCHDGPYFPSPPEDGELLGASPWRAVEFSDAIRFEVEVPAKNQRGFEEQEEIPTRYRIWWNGVVVLVSWEMAANTFPGMAGGHIIEEILEAAIEKVGYTLLVQGCNPTCTYRFAHSTVWLRPGDVNQVKIQYLVAGNFPTAVLAQVPLAGVSDPLAALYGDIIMPLILFTRVKNLGRRVLDLEESARRDLTELLSLNSRHAELGLFGFREKIKRRWALRGWRKHGRRLVARLWLQLAEAEAMRRTWSEQNFAFQRRLVRGMDALFARDTHNEADQVKSLDFSLLRGAVEDAATRQDNRALIAVTAVGAIAGALAGAVVSGILAG